MPLQKSQSTFLLLPLELRLQIYECIFLCKKQIKVHSYRKPRAERSIPPSILRTCKQIHQEASPILYSKNTFSISFPQAILKWLSEIGRANIKLLNTIHIEVIAMENSQDMAELSARKTISWYKMLDVLAREATGLRHIEINWLHSCGPGDYGTDVRFARELAKIQGLQSMVVEGFYGVHWPRYLTKTMGVAVVEKPNDEVSPRWIQCLTRLQRDSEDLYP